VRRRQLPAWKPAMPPLLKSRLMRAVVLPCTSTVAGEAGTGPVIMQLCLYATKDTNGSARNGYNRARPLPLSPWVTFTITRPVHRNAKPAATTPLSPKPKLSATIRRKAKHCSLVIRNRAAARPFHPTKTMTSICEPSLGSAMVLLNHIHTGTLCYAQ